MKYVRPATWACVAASLFSVSACDTYPHDKVAAIVTAPYPGKHQLDQCSPYADALFNALSANNIEAWKVYYMGGGWRESYKHAMVVYKNAGSFWYADNLFPFPTKSSGKDPLDCARERDPNLIVVTRIVPDDMVPQAPATAVPAR